MKGGLLNSLYSRIRRYPFVTAGIVSMGLGCGTFFSAPYMHSDSEKGGYACMNQMFFGGILIATSSGLIFGGLEEVLSKEKERRELKNKVGR